MILYHCIVDRNEGKEGGRGSREGARESLELKDFEENILLRGPSGLS